MFQAGEVFREDVDLECLGNEGSVVPDSNQCLQKCGRCLNLRYLPCGFCLDHYHELHVVWTALWAKITPVALTFYTWLIVRLDLDLRLQVSCRRRLNLIREVYSETSIRNPLRFRGLTLARNLTCQEDFLSRSIRNEDHQTPRGRGRID